MISNIRNSQEWATVVESATTSNELQRQLESLAIIEKGLVENNYKTGSDLIRDINTFLISLHHHTYGQINIRDKISQLIDFVNESFDTSNLASIVLSQKPV